MILKVRGDRAALADKLVHPRLAERAFAGIVENSDAALGLEPLGVRPDARAVERRERVWMGCVVDN